MDTGVFQSGAEWIDRNALVVAWQNPYWPSHNHPSRDFWHSD